MEARGEPQIRISLLLMSSAEEVEEENARRREDESAGAEQPMEERKGSDWLKLTCETLSVDAAARLVGDEGCGAISMFIGTTRDTFEGRRVIRLEYEAYEAMAESELRKVCRGAREEWPGVRHICIHHRLGIVPVSEASVVIAISSPHRQDSLQAVQYCINTLKSTVPIWKKEVYEDDGSSWKENQECPWGRSKESKKT